MLIRASGTLKSGREVGYWVRATVSCRRSDDRWLLTHEPDAITAQSPQISRILDRNYSRWIARGTIHAK
jgi:hypothetical protein